MRLQGPLFIWWPRLFNLLESASPTPAPPCLLFVCLFFSRSFTPLKNPGQLPYKRSHILDLVHCFLEVWIECSSVHFLLTLSNKVFTPKHSTETTFLKTASNNAPTRRRVVSVRLCEHSVFPKRSYLSVSRTPPSSFPPASLGAPSQAPWLLPHLLGLDAGGPGSGFGSLSPSHPR